MGVKLTKHAADIGIVVTDSEKALKFYRDTLGFAHSKDMPVPGKAKMHRLLAGTCVIKLVKFADNPPAANPPGGIAAASGIRYFTFSVANLDEILADCEKGGYKVIWTKREVRPGVFVGMVEDPDGNWVEFLEEGVG